MQTAGVESSLVAAAHELKTPLVLLRQLALELENTDDENRRIEVVRRIKLTTERSLRLVDNLTKIANLDGAMFDMEPIQLPGLCYEVVNELTPLSRALGQSFNIKNSRVTPVAVGHRELMRSLIMSLIDNALQYNSDNQPIKISSKVERNEATIAIRDYGPIMEISQYKKLEQSLGNQAMPIAARPLSSGLGLMIAGQLVRAMQGRLSVSRHHSGGMTFRVHLPASRQLALMDLV